MKIDPTGGTSNFARIASSPPANLPAESSGKMPPNDNLKHENVQVHVNSTAPDFVDTPPGSKTTLNYLA